MNATTGVLTTVVNFSSGTGANPNGLVSDGSGYFWGTTQYGGTSGDGTVFKVNATTGVLTTVVNFNFNDASNKGRWPLAGLVSDGSGFLWGTTRYGGTSGFGTVFKVNATTGVLTTLVVFTNNGTSNKGANPTAGLVSDGSGYIWGTTSSGGSSGFGTVFRLSFGPAPTSISASAVISASGTLATLQGMINPHGLASTATFEWGTDPTLGTSTSTSAGTTTAGTSPVAVFATITGLVPNTTYYYRVTASNAENAITQKSEILSFTTPPELTPVDATEIAAKGVAVPRAGVSGSGIPAGAVWDTFGVPSINDAGQCVVLATYKVGTVSTTAILGWDMEDMEGTMKVVVKKGGAVPGITNAVYGGFKEPLLGPDGSVAWIATLANATGTTGAVVAANSTAICLDADGTGAGAAVVVARKGAVATGATIWKTFTSVALGENVVAFTGVLETKIAGVSPGPGGATALNDSGLWVYNRGNSTTTLALRKGESLMGSTVMTIGALVARPGSPGQGHGAESDGADDLIPVRVTLADKRQAVGNVTQNGVLETPYVAGGAAVDYGAGALWLNLGIPTQNVASAMAFLGTVKVQTGTATGANNVAIFVENEENAYYTLARLVSKGDAASGVSGGIFSALKDPVNAAGYRSVAFPGTMKASIPYGISGANDSGIWHYDDFNGLSLMAREGAQPPEAAEGAQWKAFTSLALPDGSGPIFVATMHNNIAGVSPGPGGITAANDMGLWATDSTGSLRLLLQEGDVIGTSTVKKFEVISSVTGSPAQTRSFNSNGSVVVKVTDMLGAQHLLHIALP